MYVYFFHTVTGLVQIIIQIMIYIDNPYSIIFFLVKLISQKKSCTCFFIRRGGSRGERAGGAPPPNMIFLRKIVIFHTKYPQNYRASPLGAINLRAPPNLKSWSRPWFGYWAFIWSRFMTFHIAIHSIYSNKFYDATLQNHWPGFYSPYFLRYTDRHDIASLQNIKERW